MNKTASIIIVASLILGFVIVFSGQSKNDLDSTRLASEQNVEIKDGIQYVTINARGGYSPKVSVVQANVPTKLIVKTDGTYDCSASLVIRSIGYQKILSQTGEEIIDLGTQKAGTKMLGTCGMGMYNFSLNFI